MAMSFRVRSVWCVAAAALVAVGNPRARADALPEGYTLVDAPLAAYDRFQKQPFGKQAAMPEAERKFLERVWAVRSKKGATDDGLLLDAMWFASDAGGDVDRKKYAE